MNLDAFLNAMGVSLLPPIPARVPLTFSLTPGTAPTSCRRAPEQASRQKVDSRRWILRRKRILPSSRAASSPSGRWIRMGSFSQSLCANRRTAIGFAPLLGAKRLSHALFLGDEHLLDFHRAEVSYYLRLSSSSEIEGQLGKNCLAIRVRRPGLDHCQSGPGPLRIRSLSLVNAIDQTLLKVLAKTLLCARDCATAGCMPPCSSRLRKIPLRKV